MRVAILGYGVEGKVSADYWRSQGAEVTVCDANEAVGVPTEYERHLGVDWLVNLGAFDLLVRTPGLRPDAITVANPGIDVSSKMTSNVREFMDKCPAPIIGVTGTKGKGTTATLISSMLEAAGWRVFTGGNIGVPPLAFLPQVTARDVVVLELSSFQLFDVTRSPQIGVCLMVVPEHLNWHLDVAEYTAAKGNIFAWQVAGDRAVYYPANAVSSELVERSAGTHVPYGEAPGAMVQGADIVIDGVRICRTDEVALLGPHNLQNVCAAITAVWELIGHDAAAVRAAVMAFRGLPHHLELAGETNGVRYYDDSFASVPESAVAAIRSFNESKVIILGGSDKHANFTELARVVENEGVIHALLIGDTAPQLATALDAVGFHHYTIVKWQNMAHLVQTASHLVEPGDVVLLSPACASFGLFTNYKERGDQFKAAVVALGGTL